MPRTRTATLEQRDTGRPTIEASSNRALPDSTKETRSKVADSLGGGDGMEPPAVRSDRESSSEKKNDPRGKDQKPSRPAKTHPATNPPAAKVEPPKPAPPAAPISADSPAQKPVAPSVAQAPATPAPAPVRPQPPKPATVEKKELGAEEIRRIRSAIEAGLSNYRGIAAFKTQNRRSARERTLDAIFSAAGETPRAGDRFAAAKRLAREAGGEELLKMVEDLYKN